MAKKEEDFSVCYRGNWAPSLPNAGHYKTSEYDLKPTVAPPPQKRSVKTTRALEPAVFTGAQSKVSEMAKKFANKPFAHKGRQLFNDAHDEDTSQKPAIASPMPLEATVPIAPEPKKPEPKPDRKTPVRMRGQSFRDQRLQQEQMFNSASYQQRQKPKPMQKPMQQPMRNPTTGGYNPFAGIDAMAHPGFNNDAAPAAKPSAAPAYNPFASHQQPQPQQPYFQQQQPYYQQPLHQSPPQPAYGIPNSFAAPAPAPASAFDIDDLWTPSSNTSAPAPAAAPVVSAPAPASAPVYDNTADDDFFGIFSSNGAAAAEATTDDAPPQTPPDSGRSRTISSTALEAAKRSASRRARDKEASPTKLTTDLQALVDSGALTREQALGMMGTEPEMGPAIAAEAVENSPKISSQASRRNESFNQKLRELCGDKRRHAELQVKLMDPVPEDLGELRLYVCKSPGINEIFTLGLAEGMVPLCTAVLGDTDSKVKKKFHKHVKPDLFITLHGARREEGKPMNLLGRLKGNLLRSEFTFYDGGLSSKQAKGKIDVRQELGAVMYRIEKNKMRHMDVLTPALDADTTRATQFRPMKHADRMIALYKSGRKHNIMVHHNRHPKIGDDQFNLDVSFPMSIYQAFCIALSSIYARHG